MFINLRRFEMALDNIRLHVVIFTVVFKLSAGTDCPDVWVPFEGSCYLFVHEHKGTFQESRTYCQQHHNSHLVHVETETENLFLKDEVTHSSVSIYWMGLTDELIDGIWKWNDTDEIATFFDWNKSTNEPNGHDAEDCVVFHGSYRGRWVDLACTTKINPICELRAEIQEIVG